MFVAAVVVVVVAAWSKSREGMVKGFAEVVKTDKC